MQGSQSCRGVRGREVPATETVAFKVQGAVGGLVSRANSFFNAEIFCDLCVFFLQKCGRCAILPAKCITLLIRAKKGVWFYGGFDDFDKGFDESGG